MHTHGFVPSEVDRRVLGDDHLERHTVLLYGDGRVALIRNPIGRDGAHVEANEERAIDALDRDLHIASFTGNYIAIP